MTYILRVLLGLYVAAPLLAAQPEQGMGVTIKTADGCEEFQVNCTPGITMRQLKERLRLGGYQGSVAQQRLFYYPVAQELADNKLYFVWQSEHPNSPVYVSHELPFNAHPAPPCPTQMDYSAWDSNPPAAYDEALAGPLSFPINITSLAEQRQYIISVPQRALVSTLKRELADSGYKVAPQHQKIFYFPPPYEVADEQTYQAWLRTNDSEDGQLYVCTGLPLPNLRDTKICGTPSSQGMNSDVTPPSILFEPNTPPPVQQALPPPDPMLRVHTLVGIGTGAVTIVVVGYVLRPTVAKSNSRHDE